MPLDLGYPHAMLSGARNKHVSAADPGSIVHGCGAFSGVEEPRVSDLSLYSDAC